MAEPVTPDGPTAVPDTPRAAVMLIRAALQEIPIRLGAVCDQHRLIAATHDGPPHEAATSLLPEIADCGQTFATNIASLGIAVGASRPVSSDFAALHGADGLNVGQACTVLEHAARTAVRQAIARVQECDSTEQVAMVLEGLRVHMAEMWMTAATLTDAPC